MEQKIRENTARFQALGDGKDQAVVLDMLSILSKILSEFRDARVENLSLDGKEIRLDGQAESFEQVDRIKEMLSASERFEGVKLAGAKMDKKANAVKFNFSMEWK
jgi:Tfp pilus assembly protein PilN